MKAIYCLGNGAVPIELGDGGHCRGGGWSHCVCEWLWRAILLVKSKATAVWKYPQ